MAPPAKAPISTEPPVDHTDVDETTGMSHGHSVEPEEPPAAAPAVTAPVERPERVDRDEALSAIYASRSDELRQEREGYSPEELEQVQLLEGFAAGDNAALAAMNREAAAPTEEGGAPAPSNVAPPTTVGTAAPPTSDLKFKLNVYGEEREVTLEEAQRLLSKEVAADTRQRANSAREQELADYADELNSYRDRIVNASVKTGGDPNAASARTPGQPPSAATPPSPTRDVARPPTDRARIEKTVQELYSGDVARGTDALMALVTDVSQGRAQSPTPPLEEVARQVTPLVRQQMNDEEREKHRVAANSIFKTEFADVFADPVLAAGAQAYMARQLADPANAGKTYEELARDVGTHVRTNYARPGASTPPTDPARRQPPTAQRRSASDELANRRDVKSRLPVRPGSTSARVPLTDPEPPPVDSSDVVRQMRIARGQPV